MNNEQNQLRRDIYLLLSTLCRQAPDRDLLQFLTHIEIEQGIPELTLAWQQLAQTASIASVSDLEDEYQDLFIGVGKGEVIPFGSWHQAGSLMDQPLAKVRHDLKRLGFEREDNVKEPEDHISALCDVVAMLIDQGDELDAQQFFNAHLSPWYRDFCRQFDTAPSANFYLAVARLIQAFFDVEQVKYVQAPEGSRGGVKIDVKNITI
ncbi:TorD/DmsD family molecular chaperone [Vibrio hippocampi]|uniref:Chaperone protein TorD n=1 Tax=Vibrio hippocampi TaxID=654686 RepID=A0ABN8DHH2_9VIBR|nr:molecular chaperone [Vibrio hippocampi]CAH0525963.1 Chaperone protein TorD [Vibrio hippocampi]